MRTTSGRNGNRVNLRRAKEELGDAPGSIGLTDQKHDVAGELHKVMEEKPVR